jgi:hypothetical protein
VHLLLAAMAPQTLVAVVAVLTVGYLLAQVALVL